MLAGNMLFCAFLGTETKELFEASSPKFLSNKMFVCNNIDETCFSDTLIFAGSLVGVEILAFQARVSTSPSGPSRCFFY